MSSPSQPAGTASTAADPRLGVLGERARRDDVGGQLDRERERIVLAQLLGHLAADQDTVGATTEVLEHGELVVDLGAARDQDERSLDLAEQAAEVLELGEQQQPRVGGQEVRDRLGRAVRAMRRAERVVDVEIVAVRELAGVPRVVPRLAGVEAGVLEHAQPLVGHETAQPLLDRSHRERRPVVVGLRPPEVRADVTAAAPRSSSRLQRRERRPDPRVVGDLAVRRAARSGRRGRGRACPRRRPSRRSAAASSQRSLPTRSTSRQL